MIKKAKNKQVPIPREALVRCPQAPERVLCAALWLVDDKEYVHQPANVRHGFVVCGRRHHNCFAVLKACGVDRLKYKIRHQGFVTTRDRFVSRKIAAEVAFNCKQTKKLYTELFSEDVW